MIVVTGATGTVGGEVVRQLAQAGADVRALVRDPVRASALADAGAEIVQGDLLDPRSLGTALDGADHLMLITAFVPDLYLHNANAIAAAKRAGGVHVVKMSAIGTSPDSPVALIRDHARAEEELKASGLDWTLLHPHSFMQNLLMSAPTIAGEGALYGCSGEGRIAAIDTRDIASVALRALTERGHLGKTYLLTGPEALTYGEVAGRLSEVLGREVRYVDLDPEEYKGSLTGFGVPEPIAEDLRVIYGEVFRGGNGAVVTSTVADVTGTPARSLAEFVRDHASAFGA